MSESLRQVVRLTEARTEQAALETLVEVAAEICGAHYSVALVLGPDNATSAIAHRGMAVQDVAKLPHLPRAMGLVGHVLEGNVLRVEDLTLHERAVGLPAGHVPMRALLAVPLQVSRRVMGGMWLTRRPDAPPFSEADEASVVAIAQQAGAVIGSIRRAGASSDLFGSLQDMAAEGVPGQPAAVPVVEASPETGIGSDAIMRLDLPASVTIRRLVAATRSMLGMQMAFLSRIDGPRQVFAVVEAEPGGALVSEGTEVDIGEGYCSLMLDERIPSSVPDLRVHPLTSEMPVTRATGAVNYCGVPVHLPDGTVFGSLCGLDRDPTVVLTASRLEALRTMARLIGARLQDEVRQQGVRDARQRLFAPLVLGQGRWTVVQPITDLRTGLVAGFEALSRFQETTGAPRRPDEVFDEAAKLGVAKDLEWASVRSALALLPELSPSAYLSVNVSPRTVLDPATYAMFAAHPGDQVVIELTEQEQVADYPAVLSAIAGLRERGARLAIDDVGAGFAGLQHLARLSPDIVKLDISFVRDIDTDTSRRAVARAVIGFAAEVGASLVAEGIETQAELDVLRELGATHGQGYLLGRPDIPAAYLTLP